MLGRLIEHSGCSLRSALGGQVAAMIRCDLPRFSDAAVSSSSLPLDQNDDDLEQIMEPCNSFTLSPPVQSAHLADRQVTCANPAGAAGSAKYQRNESWRRARWAKMLYLKLTPVVAQCSYCGHYMASQHQLVSTYCPGTCGITLHRGNDPIYKKTIPDFGEVFDETPLMRGVVTPNASDIPFRPWYVKINGHASMGTQVKRINPKAPKRFPVPIHAKKKYRYRMAHSWYFYKQDRDRLWHTEHYPKLNSPAVPITPFGSQKFEDLEAVHKARMPRKAMLPGEAHNTSEQPALAP